MLDVGCGNGSLTQDYLRYAQSVFGIELSETGAALAGKVLGDQHVRVASAYDDFTSLFDGQSRFDAIVSTEVIEHRSC